MPAPTRPLIRGRHLNYSRQEIPSNAAVAKMHQFHLAVHLTPLSVFWQTTLNVWVWTCMWGVCTKQHIIIFSYGFKLFTTQEKMLREETPADPTGHQKQRINFFFFSASVPSQTWQLSELKDRRANNYLSQVVAVIVGGWRMIEQSCVCMCVFETACPFDLVLIQTHRETVLCPQTRGLLSPEQAQPITPSKPLQWRQRAAEQDEWLGPGWKPLYQEEEGWRVCLVVGGENISKFRCRIQADFFFFEQTRLSSSFFLFCGLALCWWCYQSNPNSADMFLVHGVLQGGWVWLNDIPLCLQICEQVQTWLQAQRDSTDRFGIAGKQLVSPHYLTSNQILAASADFFSFGVCYMQWKCVNIATAIIETDFESASIMSRGHWHVRDAYLQTQTSTLVWRLCLAERWISRQ